MATWSDAWLLWAISFGDGDLSEALAVADGFNHAIPTYEEWVSAFRILGQRGLIDRGIPFPRVTDAGRNLLSHFKASHSSFAPLVERIAALPIVADEEFPPPTKQEFRAGYDRYHKRAEEFFK